MGEKFAANPRRWVCVIIGLCSGSDFGFEGRSSEGRCTGGRRHGATGRLGTTRWGRRRARGSVSPPFGLITHYGVVGRERSPASNEIGMGLESTP